MASSVAADRAAGPSMDTTPLVEPSTTDKCHDATTNGDESPAAQPAIEATSSSVDAASLLDQATELKMQGNSHFSAREYDKAVRCYSSGLQVVSSLTHSSSSTENSWTALEVALRSNLAICLLKIDRFQDAQEQCTEALALDPSNAKVWYRRGLAREGIFLASNDNESEKDTLSVLSEAIVDLETCLSHFPPQSQQSGPQQKMMAAARDALERMQCLWKENQQQQNLQASQQQQQQQQQQNSTSPRQQRQDVVRLLLARQQSLEQQSCEGEAFFLLNWSWWCAWCRHVDFFYLQQENGNAPQCNSGGGGVGKRQREVLKLLPPGASIPTVHKNPNKRLRGSSDGDTFSSSEDEDEGDELDRGDVQGPPDVIDNSCLLVLPEQDAATPQHTYYRQWNPHLQALNDDQDSFLLQPNLVRGYHYELVPREVYFALCVWYGEVSPSICRRAERRPSRTIALPMYPEQHLKRVVATRKVLCGACRGPNAKSRCKRCMSVHYCDRSCQESHWPYHKFACKRLARAKSNGEEQPNEQRVTPKQNIVDEDDWGRVGLNNLGNTCFMGSAIQCLSHATPLTRHFLSNRFKSDLNSTNPLGTGGKLANAYDTVMKDIWMGGIKGGPRAQTSTSPTALKRAIAVFAPRFAGCSQHDAQEFLAYLLDGLHEDLNRIRKAPYVEMPSVTEGQNMAIAGAEAWDAHRRRNDSLVMDTFYGQFKSTCVCPQCNRVSVSFDTFNHVSLEVPQFHNMTRTILVLVVRSSVSSTPTRYGLSIRRNEFVGELRRALSELCEIPVTHLAICDVYEHAIYEILQDSKPVSAIRPTDVLAAYEVDPYTNVTIHAIASNTVGGKSKQGELDTQDGVESFGFPFLTSFDAQLTCKQLWDHVWGQVQVLVGSGTQNGSSSRLDDESREEHEKQKRSLLQIRVVDNSGTPRPVFLDEDLSNVETSGVDSSSILPATLDEKIEKYLGKGCTERFLFLHLEWSEAVEQDDGETAPVSLFQKDRFLSYVDHPSLAQAVQKQRAMNGIKGVTIEQCFETFTRPERLDEHNKWYCSKCKEHVRAMKTMELWRLPNVLVVHLKRFEFKHALRRDKLDTLVDFPLDGLDMSKHCASSSPMKPESQCNGDASGSGMDQSCFVVEDGVPAIYDLFAVTNHYGRMGFGHYTAFARKWNEQEMSRDWALFDDSSVRSVGDGTGRNGNQGVVTPAAYVLFYRRRVFN